MRVALLSYSEHTLDMFKCPQSSFGIQDRHALNVNFKLLLDERGKYIVVWVNGLREKKKIQDGSISKKKLAIKSVKFVTDLGRWLSIGYDLKKG